MIAYSYAFRLPRQLLSLFDGTNLRGLFLTTKLFYNYFKKFFYLFLK